MLHGRSEECSVISDMLDQAREGRSSVLVLRGEAGVGKSVLLEFAERTAGGLLVLRCTGIESEIELPFSALHQLLRPALDRLDELPGRQADTLRAAVGLDRRADAPTPAEPLAVSVALLGFLAELAAPAGLLCLLDDGQWLDHASAAALTFAARRLEAEGVVLLFGVRDDDQRQARGRGLPELAMTGLGPAAAAALLDDRVPGLPAPVRHQLITGTLGNPLALIELTAVLTAAQLAGREPLPDPLPLGRGIEAVYAHRLQTLDPSTRTLLLVAATEELGELGTVLGAAAALGGRMEDLESAESRGLLTVSAGRLAFRHPLIRAAAYQSADGSSRRAAHRALADVLSDTGNADRRAWHRAAATVGTDDVLAGELERSADRSRARGGFAASAKALERAGQLTSHPDDRGRLFVLAAEEAWLSGQADHCVQLLDQARPLATSPELAARIQRLRGEIEVRDGSLDEAYRLLLASADLDGKQPDLALETLLLAGEVAGILGDPRLAREVAERARALGDPGAPEQATKVQLLDGFAAIFAGDVATGARLLGSMLAHPSGGADPARLLLAARAVMPLGDLDAARRLTRSALELVRSSGAATLLPPVLGRLAAIDLFAGRLRDAEAHATDSLRLAYPSGLDASVALNALALVSAYRGDAARCRDLAGRSSEIGTQRQIRMVNAGADWAVGLLELGLGRPEHAVARLSALADEATGHPGLLRWATPDLVEAAVRVGEPGLSARAVARLEAWARGTQLPGSLAAAARCRALLAGPEDAERHFRAALEHDARASRPLERARTELLLGEHLRRHRQRSRSRAHLRRALAVFDRVGARAWAERATGELRATGETVQRRDAGQAELTPQEVQVAQLAAEGSSNTEIAVKLLLSRRTVEYHLAKVFTKLGISSRQQLTRM